MAIQQLNLRMGANVSGAVNGINQVNNQLGALNNTTRRGTRDFTNYSRVIQDVPYGFNAIANNLTQLIPGVGALGLAFSALIAGLTFAQVGFGAWTRGLGDASEKAKEHIKALNEAREALKDYVQLLNDVSRARVVGLQNAQEELVNLRTLYEATQNANIPLAKRKQLVDELQEQYPKYFANIKDEIILAGGAKTAYDKLTTAIIASARARANQDELVNIQKEIIPLEQKYADEIARQVTLQQQLAKETAYVEKIRAKVREEEEKASKQREGGLLKAPQRSTTSGNFDTRERRDLQRELNESLATTKEILDEIGDRQRRVKLLAEDLTSAVEKTPDALLDPAGNLKKVSETKPEFNFFDRFLSFDPVKAKEKSKEAAEAYKIATEFALANQEIFVGLDKILKADTKVSAIKTASEWWKDFQAGLVRFKLEPATLVTEGPERKLVGPKKPLEMVFDIKMKLGKIETDKKAEEELVKKLQDDLNRTLASSFVTVPNTLGESIGAAIASGVDPIEAAGRSIIGAIGDLVTQIGKALVEYGVVKTGLDKIIAGGIAIPGVAAIGLGVAAIAMGALIKNSFAKVKKFAEGGLAFGPAFGIVGEGKNINRSNPEVIAPLDKLKKFIGGGQQPQVVVLNPVLRGKDMVLQQTRTNNAQRRLV